MSAHLATLGFSFAALMLMVRMLSKAEFGTWVLYLTLVSIAEMSRTGFVQNGLVKFCSDSPKDYSAIITTSLALNICMSLIMWAVLGLLAYPLGYLWSTPELYRLIMWYGAYTLTLGSLRFLEYIQMANNDFKGVFWGNCIQGIVFTSCMLYFWLSDQVLSLYYLIPLQSFAALCGLLFVSLFVRSYLKWGKFSTFWWKKLIHYGKFVFGTNISSIILQRIDVIMIGYFLTPVAVAYYNIALKITNYLEIPLKGISQVNFPKIAHAYKHHGEEKVARIYERTIGLLEALEIPLFVFLFFFSKEIIFLLAGPSYEDSELILKILLLTALFKPFSRIFGTTLDAIGKPQMNLKMLLYSMIINGLLNVMFIPLMGTIGAAVATVLAVIFTVIWGQWWIAKIIPFRLDNIMKACLTYYFKGIYWVRQQWLDLRSA